MALPFRKPIIGITANLLTETTPFPGAERTAVYHEYIAAVSLAGGIPLVLPLLTDADDIRQQVQMLDGLLVSGGYDINPGLYGEDPSPLLGDVLPKRDIFEMEAIRTAYFSKKPIFGICRGLQIINVAFGGTLYQDISLAFDGKQPLSHQQKNLRHEPVHSVDVRSDSVLFQIFASSAIRTNSFHHQAIKQLAPGFRVSAIATDGIIEGIEKNGKADILAVQWHPEMMVLHDDSMLALFRHFIAKAARQKSQKQGAGSGS